MINGRDKEKMINIEDESDKTSYYDKELQSLYKHTDEEIKNNTACMECGEPFHWIETKEQFIQVITENINESKPFDSEMVRLYRNIHLPGMEYLYYDTNRHKCSYCQEKEKRCNMTPLQCRLCILLTIFIILMILLVSTVVIIEDYVM